MAETAAPARPAEVGTFPKSLPYTPEQLLDDDVYPGPIDEP